jgi:hypothetical protein
MKVSSVPVITETVMNYDCGLAARGQEVNVGIVCLPDSARQAAKKVTWNRKRNRMQVPAATEHAFMSEMYRGP